MARNGPQVGASALSYSSRPLSSVTCGQVELHCAEPSGSHADTPKTPTVALRQLSTPNKTPRRRGQSVQPPRLSSAQIRNILVDYLANGRNADAIAFYVEMLQQHRGDWTAQNAEGFAWLFVQYRQADLARHAAAKLHDQGFAISTALASKILRMHKDELVYEPESLALVLEWLSQGLGREKRAGTAVDEGMLETVLDALKRMGRTDWLEQVFGAYRDTLEVGEVGSARLWSFVIGAKLLDGDVRAAERLFDAWRAGYHASHSSTSAQQTSPPPAPYLVLLAHYASRPHSGLASRDPAYRFIAICRSDGIKISSDYLDLLLRTELLRKQHSSFWGLWQAYDDPALGLVRSRATWLLAVRAKMRAHDSHRDSPKRMASPMRRLVSFTYEPTRAPSSRQLFKRLIRQRLIQTGHRPTRRLCTAKMDPFVSADVLNLFLEHFVATRDWQAATVVLETFRVHRVEPNFRTHGNVVLGVVKQWRRGKVPGALDYAGPTGDDDALHAFDDPQVREAEERGFSAVRSQQQGLDLIRKILEQRKMRLGLWSRDDGGQGAQPETPSGNGGGSPGPEGDELDHPAAVTSRWMAQRERRDLEYLVSLLRRCEGVDEKEWDRLMVKTRKEILPQRRPAPRLTQSTQPDKAKIYTRGRRHRAAVRAARLHLDK